MTPSVIRRAAFALTLTFAVVTPAAAQGGLGIKGGLMASRLSTTPDSSDVLGTLTDFTAGVFGVVGSRAPVTAQFEAMISRRGATIVGSVIGLGSFGKVRSTYLDVSAFVRAQTAGDSANRFYFFAGPTIGFEMKTEFIVAGFATDLDFATEDWDVILAAGAGVEVGHFLIEGRYSHGLSNLLVGADLFGFQAKHRSASLVAGVRF
ncbi:MAG TPA: porin family protein [Vicinamibacterales bacterium]|nr:porin family protein [Vicinamibacterales bacterium]